MTPKIRTIIIEDDPTAVEYLSSILLTNFKSIDIIGTADKVTNAVQLINSLKPELVFMDIELLDGNSFEIFYALNYNEFEVVFVTAFDNYLKSAIEHFAFSYVVKPYDAQKIIEIVDRYQGLKERLFSISKYNALSNFLNNKDARFLLNIGNEHVSVRIKDIIKCISEGNYTQFYLINGEKYLASHSLKYYEELLANKGFFKAHRSTLINTEHIESIYKKETIILTNKDKIHISVRNRSKLTELFDSFL